MLVRSFLLPVSLVLVGACSSESSKPSTESAPHNAVADAKAKEIFSLRCTPCHGPEGRGNGAASATLTPKPRNFHDKKWQGQVTDEHIERIIQYGGAAVGKSPAMPANPDLTGNRDVVVALRSVIRTFSHD